jgi:hypothetical protein
MSGDFINLRKDYVSRVNCSILCGSVATEDSKISFLIKEKVKRFRVNFVLPSSYIELANKNNGNLKYYI